MLTEKPNILLIMPDQMRGDCLSLEDHPVLTTPNIDSLGTEGVHFSRTYSTCPSCIAARRSLLTGQFPATHGMVGYRERVPLRVPTVTQLLRDGGYATAIAVSLFVITLVFSLGFLFLTPREKLEYS